MEDNVSALKLKPCPFCGGDAEEANYLTEGAVRCVSCYAKIVRRHGSHEDNGGRDSMASWNTRTPTLPDALALPEVKALVEAAHPIAFWTIGNMLADDPKAAEEHPHLSRAILNLRAALAALTTINNKV